MDISFYCFLTFDCDGCLSEVNKLIKRQKYEEKKTWKNTEDTFIKQQKNVFL